MDRTEKVIKYLKKYQHICYIKSDRTNSKPQADALKEEFKELGSLIKELEEHGYRRII
jgi:hypothetical protein